MQDTINKLKNELDQLGDELFNHPELGYKEFKTREILIKFFKKYDVQVENEYALTGFSVSVGTGYPHIGLIAELDAVITPNHRCATNLDHAAHSCGHSTQCVLMTAAFLSLKDTVNKGKVTLFFSPAEEYLDIEYRKKLKEEGKITAFGGKQEMLLNHVFDGVDLFIHAHGMGEAKERYSIHSSLAGFNYQVYQFKGKSAHAAVAPSEGHNALNMFQLFNVAVGFLRETFVDEDKNRFHGHILSAGNSVNSVPDELIYEAYVRSFNPEQLQSLSKQLEKTAQHCAEALQGTCLVTTTMGYQPMMTSIELGNLINEEVMQFCSSKDVRYYEKSIAAGDIGDLSMFYPLVQLGYSGFKGRMHGSDLEIIDKDLIYFETATIVSRSVMKLLNNLDLVKTIKDNFETKMTFAEYTKTFRD